MHVLSLIFSGLSFFCMANQHPGNSILQFGMKFKPIAFLIDSFDRSGMISFSHLKTKELSMVDEVLLPTNAGSKNIEVSKPASGFYAGNCDNNFILRKNNEFMKTQKHMDMFSISGVRNTPSLQNNHFFETNRRNIYSSLWAFASLNYLYCDLVALMDKDLHTQYHTGQVDGTNITPGFLAGAAAMMQISIANVFLPQIIKNDRALKWVQISSGIAMTLIQSATLFVGKQTPYYATFSAFEIGATTFISINALRWKTNPKKISAGE